MKTLTGAAVTLGLLLGPMAGTSLATARHQPTAEAREHGIAKYSSSLIDQDRFSGDQSRLVALANG